MIELVYHSIAAEGVDTADILTILDEANRFNSQHSITGCLLYYKGEFVQILEGDAQEVKSLFGKIAKDPRHIGVNLLVTNQISERNFKDWNMAFSSLSESSFEALKVSSFAKNIVSLAGLVDRNTRGTDTFWTMARDLCEEDFLQ